MSKEAITLRLDKETIKRLDDLVKEMNENDEGLGVECSRADVICELINREQGDWRLRRNDLSLFEDRIIRYIYSLRAQINVLMTYAISSREPERILKKLMKEENLARNEAIEKICNSVSGGLDSSFWTSAAWKEDLHLFFTDGNKKDNGKGR